MIVQKPVTMTDSNRMIDRPRGATAELLPGVIALVNGALRQGSSQTMLTDYPLVYRNDNLQNLSLLTVNGVVASVVPFLPRAVEIDGCRFTLGIISPTATLPEFQHRGFGKRCLERSTRRMEASNVELSVLWTLVETFPFYELGGYHPVKSQAIRYRLERKDSVLFHGSDEISVIIYDQERAFSMEIAETGEVIGLQFLGGRLVIGDDKRTPHRRVTRAQLAGALFGDHRSRPTERIDEWNDIGDFYFPIGILDCS